MICVFQLVECPSIYEMLPNPEFNWKKQPEIIVWRNGSENGQDTVKMERYGTSGSVGLFVEALKDNEVLAFYCVSNFQLRNSRSDSLFWHSKTGR